MPGAPSRFIARLFPKAAPEAGQGLRRVFPFLAKSGAVAGTAAVTAKAGERIIDAWKGQSDIDQSVYHDDSGTVYKDDSGRTHFVPSITFLEAWDRTNQGDRPFVTNLQQSDESAGSGIGLPLLILGLGGAVLAVLYVRGKS